MTVHPICVVSGTVSGLTVVVYYYVCVVMCYRIAVHNNSEAPQLKVKLSYYKISSLMPVVPLDKNNITK